jgi:hypothetical protein
MPCFSGPGALPLRPLVPLAARIDPDESMMLVSEHLTFESDWSAGDGAVPVADTGPAIAKSPSIPASYAH